MKNYFEESYQHYIDLKTKLEKSTGDLSDKKNLEYAISKYDKDLNNLIMAGLGMGTLYLRMGAVLMIAEKTKPEAEKDVSFLKLIAEKLIHKLPTDGDWLEIWKNYLKNQTTSSWNQIVLENKDDIHSKFVSFRNDVAHQKIIINDSFSYDRIHEISDGLITIEAMSKFRQQFQDASISQINNEVFFEYKENSGEKFKISPYVQINKNKEVEDVGVLPYLFQGNYYKGSKFINTEGAETKEEKDDAIEVTFDTIKKDIQQFNGDKAFDFNEKIKNYNEWCIGRVDEVEAILEWINKSDTDNNVLPIFAPAGLGKGALVAEVIKEIKVIKDKKINQLYHFCGSGDANNLQAILYHLILQGKENNYWNTNSLSEKFKNRLVRLPSQYTDVIELFQALLESTVTIPEKKEINITECQRKLKATLKKDPKALNGIFKDTIKAYLSITEESIDHDANELITFLMELVEIMKDINIWQNIYFHDLYDLYCHFNKHNLDNNLLSLIPKEYQNKSVKIFKPLVIIIDGIDEAFVSDQSKRISDWFYTYDDKGERKEKWECPGHIKWIFTYRQTSKENKNGFQFEYHEFKTHDLPEMQPLKGLNLTQEKLKEALKKDLKEDVPDFTDEFIKAILEKGKTKEYKTINVVI